MVSVPIIYYHLVYVQPGTRDYPNVPPLTLLPALAATPSGKTQLLPRIGSVKR